MVAIKKESAIYKSRSLNVFVSKVMIIADETPATLPTTGEGIKGMSANEYFAPGSILYVVAKDADPKWYLANESGEFVAQ